MRNEIQNEKVDAVFNLFTSFGYFDDPNDDKKVFQSVYNVLNDNGFFVLDFLNERFVKNTLEEESVVQREHITFNIHKKIENQHVIKDIKFTDQGKNFHFFEKVKLHTLEGIEKLANECNFERIKVYGNYQLDEFKIKTSPRCINIFRKK